MGADPKMLGGAAERLQPQVSGAALAVRMLPGARSRVAALLPPHPGEIEELKIRAFPSLPPTLGHAINKNWEFLPPGEEAAAERRPVSQASSGHPRSQAQPSSLAGPGPHSFHMLKLLLCGQPLKLQGRLPPPGPPASSAGCSFGNRSPPPTPPAHPSHDGPRLPGFVVRVP